MMKIMVEAELPDDDVEAYLRWIRAFDNAHGGCHFRIGAVGGDHTLDEMKQMLENIGLTVMYAERKQ